MENKGKVVIAPSVIKQIIMETIKEISGVIGVYSAQKNNFFKANEQKELDVEMTEKECVIDISVSLVYGTNIRETAVEIQNKIKENVEKLSDIEVKEVNVNISNYEKQEIVEKGDE